MSGTLSCHRHPKDGRPAPAMTLRGFRSIRGRHREQCRIRSMAREALSTSGVFMAVRIAREYGRKNTDVAFPCLDHARDRAHRHSKIFNLGLLCAGNAVYQRVDYHCGRRRTFVEVTRVAKRGWAN